MVLFNTEEIVDGHNSALAWQKLRKFADKTGARRVFPRCGYPPEIERRGPFPCSSASQSFPRFRRWWIERREKAKLTVRTYHELPPNPCEISCRPFAFKTPCGEDEKLFRGQQGTSPALMGNNKERGSCAR